MRFFIMCDDCSNRLVGLSAYTIALDINTVLIICQHYFVTLNKGVNDIQEAIKKVKEEEAKKPQATITTIQPPP